MRTKKYQLLALILFLTAVAMPSLVWAVDPVGTKIFVNPLKADNITELLTAVLDVVVQVGLVIVVFFIIYAGFQFVTAQGNTEKIKDARKALVYTLIGSAIVIGSYAIASALKSTVNQLTNGVVVQLQEITKFKT
ncbi:MAG: hypothetical protein WC640_02350 [Candidatus Paceibacterota bacterium]|jgi:uncharacterized membrane protein YjfL (UPF0719 family)